MPPAETAEYNRLNLSLLISRRLIQPAVWIGDGGQSAGISPTLVDRHTSKAAAELEKNIAAVGVYPHGSIFNSWS